MTLTLQWQLDKGTYLQRHIQLHFQNIPHALLSSYMIHNLPSGAIFLHYSPCNCFCDRETVSPPLDYIVTNGLSSKTSQSTMGVNGFGIWDVLARKGFTILETPNCWYIFYRTKCILPRCFQYVSHPRNTRVLVIPFLELWRLVDFSTWILTKNCTETTGDSLYTFSRRVFRNVESKPNLVDRIEFSLSTRFRPRVCHVGDDKGVRKWKGIN